ncbi:hypothetical protein CPARA_2gp274 (nucleomorph) [Cryptomonas paramecium]|uniref:Uncharacterized protein n=1 Tax=Cryptomonas paramaecium TaxID=2898 RepID=F2HHY6_9CRYP|nr:hypothetical protein CPARA_2gp274 [Cryptomonas paramecium]AEA38932.1 hypothetical protein CPARA_2gp274 [Cryptomonas paramecium]|mmetsp:Transcript_59201/g.157211  ORF Transcript_59201/g.157211 Transcript_59201/m.157211 type:complete len:266 (-) Transcript_59201:1745-2542(-)
MRNLSTCRKIFENLLIDSNIGYNLWFIYLYFEIKIFFSKNIKEIKKRIFLWIFFQKKINTRFYPMCLFSNLKKILNCSIFFSNHMKILFIKNTKRSTRVHDSVNFLSNINNFIYLKWSLLNFFKLELKFGNIKNLIVYFQFLSLNYFFNLLYLLINKISIKVIYKKIIFSKQYFFFLNQSKNNIYQTEIAQYANNLLKIDQFLKQFLLAKVSKIRRFIPSTFNCIQKKISRYQNISFVYDIYFKKNFYFRRVKKNLLLMFLFYFF